MNRNERPYAQLLFPVKQGGWNSAGRPNTLEAKKGAHPLASQLARLLLYVL
ncbi:MAG: hypothetical protein V4508_13105 [Pseudomonadota bacterium]